MPKPDAAHRATDDELAKLERRIARLYREAADDLQETIEAYFEKFKKRDEEMKALIGTVQNGKEWTEQDYKLWRLAQIGRGKRFESMRDKLAERMTKANEVAISYANDDMAKIYAMNHAYTIESVKEQAGEMLSGVDFTMFDEQTVKRLVVEQPDLMPYYPKAKAVKRGIDLIYGKKQITATVTSGILQGSSINKMAKDLMNRVTDMNKTSAVRAARTAVTEAENAGRQAAADDGQIVENNKPFVVGGEELMFPGDKSFGASGWNRYNCRCTRATEIIGFKSILTEGQRKRANIRVSIK